MTCRSRSQNHEYNCVTNDLKGNKSYLCICCVLLCYCLKRKCPNVTQLLHHRREKVLYCVVLRVQVVVVRIKLKVFIETYVSLDENYLRPAI